MDEILNVDLLKEAFQEAGLDLLDQLDSKVFMDAFNDELTKSLMETSKAAADKREADLAAQLDPQFQAKLAQDLGSNQRQDAIFARRQKLNAARNEQSRLSTDEVKAATKTAIERTSKVLQEKQFDQEQETLRAAYYSELNSLPYYPNRIDRIVEIKQKYRKLGLRNIF